MGLRQIIWDINQSLDTMFTLLVYSCNSSEKYDVANPFCSELIEVDTIVTRECSTYNVPCIYSGGHTTR